jgi:hypothetical protein
MTLGKVIKVAAATGAISTLIDSALTTVIGELRGVLAAPGGGVYFTTSFGYLYLYNGTTSTCKMAILLTPCFSGTRVLTPHLSIVSPETW